MFPDQMRNSPELKQELSRTLFKLTAARALVLFAGLNLAHQLSLLPEKLGNYSFLACSNGLALLVTIISLCLWLSHRWEREQLYFQIGADLLIATFLAAFTGGVASPFVSLYLLIITYGSLTLGRSGSIIVAALSTIFYAGVIIALHLAVPDPGKSGMHSLQNTFRIAAHALGFWAVACLGTYLHQRVQLIEGELREKIASLTRLQRLNEHIVSSIRSGLITTDLHGRIAVFNAAAAEITGRDARSMKDRRVQTLLGEAFWTAILKSDLLQNPKPLRHEDWISLPDGTKRFLGFSVSPLLDQNHFLLGYIISFQDLTEITRLEGELRLKDRMAAVGRMAAGIAHEIRNPLTAMQASVEILRTRANLPAKDERLLQILMRESDRLNKFIEDFLNYARPGKYRKQSLDLAAVLRDSVTLLRNSPEIQDSHRVTLNIETSPLRILGSADQMSQVFWNLAQNAIRAMPAGGELKIGLRRSSRGTGEVTFEDTGIGMTRAEQDELFQPLHSKFAGGLGLGLSIIFQIMEDHQGKISFESEKGRGTRVTLTFPLESEAAAAEPLPLAAQG